MEMFGIIYSSLKKNFAFQGTMLEHFLTRPPSDFAQLLKAKKVEIPQKEEAYQYSLV
jgi:hypothetical protein